MTFRDFKAQVNALPAHDLASVPCDGVELRGTDIEFVNAESNVYVVENAREQLARVAKELARSKRKRAKGGRK